MRVALVGDIGLFGVNSSPDIDLEKFGDVRGILKSHDYVIGNLETPLTECNRKILGKSAHIKGKPEDVEILNQLGITHVSLANNHILDFGKKGADDTIKNLERAGIAWFGMYGKKEYIEKSDSKVALSGYCCYSTNGVGLEDVVDTLIPERIEIDVQVAKNNDEIPILSFHWGQEHVHYPSYEHLLFARDICDKYESVIIHGHHPHVLQGIEDRNGGVISYSLGNFCFDDVYTSKSKKPLVALEKDNQKSLILSLTIEENKIVDTKIITFRFTNNRYSVEQSIEEELANYTKFLNKNKVEYERVRESVTVRRLMKRKKKRNLAWYMRRINLNSCIMIYNDINNVKKYKKIMRGFIS